MHILLLNQPFYPDVVATAQMGKDLADELVRRGHTVSAVSSRSIYGKTGASLAKFEVADGIRIHRVGTNVFGKKGFLARVFDFGLYYALAAFKTLTMRPRPDVVIGFTTPPFIAMLGIIARALRGSKSVYWVMDLYPDVGVAGGMFKPGAIPTRFMERLGRWMTRKSDAVVVLGRCMRDRLLAKGLPASNIHVITVWDAAEGQGGQGAHTERDARSTAFRTRWNLGDAFIVMYSGNLGLAHDAETIVSAVVAMKDRADVRFVFVGSGKQRPLVERAIQQHGLTNASYHDYVPREELAELLATADAHLVTVHPKFVGLIVPSKLYGVLGVGRPVIYVGPGESEVGLTIVEAGAGVSVASGQPGALVSAIDALAADPARARAMGESARRAVPGRFDRATSTKKWADLVEGLAGQRHA